MTTTKTFRVMVKSADGTQQAEVETQAGLDMIHDVIFNQRVSSKKLDAACVTALTKAGIELKWTPVVERPKNQE